LMPWAVIVIGVAVQVVVWRLVARDRLPFWPAVTTTFAVLGIGSLLAGDPSCCRETTPATASAVGLSSGLLLFGATRVVVDFATRHDVIRRSVTAVYRREDEMGTIAVSVLTLAIVVPGEELFWRGVVLPELNAATSVALGAVLAWAAWVAVDATWGSIPLLAGAVVGGALWTGLATWSGGVVAPVASHLVWTALMLVWPPRAARDKVPS
jgi:membrane protease YdiL (CAAX protease family)